MRPHNTLVEIVFGFRSDVLLKGKRKTRSHVLSDKVVVAIPSADGAGSPYIVETSGPWKDSDVRMSGGRFWRPVCLAGRPMTLETFASFDASRSGTRSDDADWYPFSTGSEGSEKLPYWRRGDEDDDGNIFDPTRFRVGTGNVRSFDRERRDDAAALCCRTAENGLLSIDGILHRACEVPVFDVDLDYGSTNIRLVLDGEPRENVVRVGLSHLDKVLSTPEAQGSVGVRTFLSKHRIVPVPEADFDLRTGNAGNLARTMAGMLAKRHFAKDVHEWGWRGREHSVASAGRIEERLALLTVAAEATRCVAGVSESCDMWRIAGEQSVSHPEIAAAVGRFEEVFAVLEPAIVPVFSPIP